MSTTRLKLYNSALFLVGERNLASLSENRLPRRLLDHLWDNGVVDFCLEQKQWKFATRTIRLDSDPSIEPDFGYQYGFVKPSDCLRTVALCSDEYFDHPIERYTDEAGYWFAETDPLYIKYISNDSQFGADLSLWPKSFEFYVGAHMAAEICLGLNQAETKQAALRKMADELLKKAASKDAMDGPTQRLPSGTWTNARAGRVDREGRGNRQELIG